MQIPALTSLVFLAFFASAHADTPANCSYEDISGLWIFQESDRVDTRQENCNTVPIRTNSPNKVFLKLSFPNVATDIFGSVGHWTLIYNQGFEVIINYRKYFAFSLYKQKGQTVISYCNATLPGWSHDLLGNNWACFKGRKVNDWKENELHQSIVGHGKEHTLKPFLFESLSMRSFLSEENVRRINEKQSSWTARVYPELAEKTTEELLKMAGGRASRLAQRPKPAESSEEVKRQVSLLPKSFDWRDHNGINYVSPVRDQGSCGSCYIFSSMALLEARVRIATNNTKKPVFSTQEVVDCSQYSQGCEGGFPYLIAGKYGQDHGVVPESCYSYVGADQQCQLSPSKASCRERTYTISYHYVGGYYGASNEDTMKLELVKNGPIAVGFEVYPDFMSYSGGVYSRTSTNEYQSRIGFDPFQLTNHAGELFILGCLATINKPLYCSANRWIRS